MNLAKKILASTNLTLLLLGAIIGLWKIKVCADWETWSRAMFKAGVEEIAAGVTEGVAEGPPLQSKLIVEMEDGSKVKVLANGEVLIERRP